MSARPTRLPPPLVLTGTAVADTFATVISDINGYDVVAILVINRELTAGATLQFRWGDADDPTPILPAEDDKQDSYYSEDIPDGYAIRVNADNPLKLAGDGATADYMLRVFYLSP